LTEWGYRDATLSCRFDAWGFVELVHGPEDAAAAQEQHLSKLARLNRYVTPTKADTRLEASDIVDRPFSFALHTASLAESRSRAVKLIESGGAYIIDGKGEAIKIGKANVVSSEHCSILRGKDGSEEVERMVLVLRVGKWKSRTIELV
jgi:tyrosyl-tRNA synthetase